MTLALALVIAAGVLAGLVAALKVIAPATKNTTDDKVLQYAEDAESVVADLQKK